MSVSVKVRDCGTGTDEIVGERPSLLETERWFMDSEEELKGCVDPRP